MNGPLTAKGAELNPGPRSEMGKILHQVDYLKSVFAVQVFSFVVVIEILQF